MPDTIDTPASLMQAAQLIHSGVQHFNQGDAGRALEDWNRAELFFEGCRETWPFVNELKIKAGLQLARAEVNRGEWESAVAFTSQVLQLDAANLDALDLRRYAYYRLGRLREHLADTQLSLRIKPDAEKHSGFLFKQNFLPETTPEFLFEQSRRWDALYAQPLAGGRAAGNTRDPDRRLRIGYVSPDLHHHPIMKFLPPVFEHANQRDFEVFVYDIGTAKDDATDQLRKTVENYIELPASKNVIADRIRADGIDILVDLAGHTNPAEALLAFALKPAPVQVTWLGCMATTGLTAMDYFIGDPAMPCPGTEHLFSETVFRLPRLLFCYRPAAELPIVPAPCLANGYVTFGCFNSKTKITRQMVKTWSLLLHLHAQSKLLLKSWDLENESVQKELRSWLMDDGIALHRIEFQGHSQPLEYLSAWNRVDIALDPFPYNGGSTTLDALWMGVPVVSLTGRLAVSCAGASMLPLLGLPVARTYEEYISIGVLLAKGVMQSPDSRERLRAAMKTSAIMDEVGLVRALEEAYRKIWRARL